MCDSFHFLIQIFSFLLKQNHGTKKAKKSTYKKQPTSILLKKISLITKTFLATCYKERNLFWNIYRHEKWMMNFTIFERHCAVCKLYFDRKTTKIWKVSFIFKIVRFLHDFRKWFFNLFVIFIQWNQDQKCKQNPTWFFWATKSTIIFGISVQLFFRHPPLQTAVFTHVLI